MQEVLRSFSRVLQDKLFQQDERVAVEILKAEDVSVYMYTKVLIT